MVSVVVGVAQEPNIGNATSVRANKINNNSFFNDFTSFKIHRAFIVLFSSQFSYILLHLLAYSKSFPV